MIQPRRGWRASAPAGAIRRPRGRQRRRRGADASSRSAKSFTDPVRFSHSSLTTTTSGSSPERRLRARHLRPCPPARTSGSMNTTAGRERSSATRHRGDVRRGNATWYFATCVKGRCPSRLRSPRRSRRPRGPRPPRSGRTGLDADPLEAEPVDRRCAATGDEEAITLDHLAVVETLAVRPGSEQVPPGRPRATPHAHAVRPRAAPAEAKQPPRPSSSVAGCAGRSSPPSRAAGRAARARHRERRRPDDHEHDPRIVDAVAFAVVQVVGKKRPSIGGNAGREPVAIAGLSYGSWGRRHRGRRGPSPYRRRGLDRCRDRRAAARVLHPRSLRRPGLATRRARSSSSASDAGLGGARRLPTAASSSGARSGVFDGMQAQYVRFPTHECALYGVSSGSRPRAGSVRRQTPSPADLHRGRRPAARSPARRERRREGEVAARILPPVGKLKTPALSSSACRPCRRKLLGDFRAHLLTHRELEPPGRARQFPAAPLIDVGERGASRSNGAPASQRARWRKCRAEVGPELAVDDRGGGSGGTPR